MERGHRPTPPRQSARLILLGLPTKNVQTLVTYSCRPLEVPPQQPGHTCATMRARLASLASLVAACSCRMISPRVVGSSHSLQGYEAERVADGNEKTYWLVPGGQRMEAMS